MITAAEKTNTPPLRICDYKIARYRHILGLQHQLHEKRLKNQIPDTILILEHHPVITLGARKSDNKLLTDPTEIEEKGIDLVSIRRGGGVTAHNPGQLVFYPIINIKERDLGITEYVRKLEQIGIELLQHFGLNPERRKKFPGLWLDRKKIASVGVRVSKSVTYHGMAINIKNDLDIFKNIIPCGIDGVEITSLRKETQKNCSMTRVKKILAKLLIKHFSSSNKTRKLPPWLKRPLPAGEKYKKLKKSSLRSTWKLSAPTRTARTRANASKEAQLPHLYSATSAPVTVNSAPSHQENLNHPIPPNRTGSQ